MLMVAEKPSLAKSLAELLSDGNYHTHGGGVTAVHEYDGVFRGDHALFHMTAVAGHLLTLDFQARFNNW